MNNARHVKRYLETVPVGLMVGALALTGWLAGTAGAATGTLAETDAVQKSQTPAVAQVGTEAVATGSETVSTSRPAVTLTPREIYLGMIEAEKRRRALWLPDPAVPRELAEQWGVHVIGVHLTAGGYWLRFAFRVDDADKAGVLFDNRFKPYLESEKTGVKLAVPSAAKVGALRTTNRQGNIKNGKIYNIMFANPGSQVTSGQKVSVVAGAFKVEHLTVRSADTGPISSQPRLQAKQAGDTP